MSIWNRERVLSMLFIIMGESLVDTRTCFIEVWVQTIIYDQDSKNWGASEVVKLVLGWGYVRNTFMIWLKLKDIYESFIEFNMDDRVAYVLTRAIGNKSEGHLYVEHIVKTSM